MNTFESTVLEKLGKIEEGVVGLRRDHEDLKDRVDATEQDIAKAKGGLRVLAWTAGIAVTVLGFVSRTFAPHR